MQFVIVYCRNVIWSHLLVCQYWHVETVQVTLQRTVASSPYTNMLIAVRKGMQEVKLLQQNLQSLTGSAGNTGLPV